jgi:peptidoglycan/LPS O-acetylase OafA/YrhL
LQSLYSRLNWNYPSWSISTEAMAYVLFVFGAAPLLRGRHPFWVAAGLYGGLVALCALKHGSLNSFTQAAALARTFAGFGLGVLLYRAWSADLFGTHRCASVAALPLFLGAYLLRLDALCVAAFAALIVLAVDMPPPLGLWLNSRPLEALGDWSYGIYLWHAPVHLAVAAGLQGIGIRLTTLTAGPARLLALGTAALVIGIAALSYRYIEYPGRQLLRTGALAGRRPSSRKDGCQQAITER